MSPSNAFSVSAKILEFVHLPLVFFFASYDDVLVILETCTCRDEVTADDVLLQALEVVDPCADCSLREDLCRLLE